MGSLVRGLRGATDLVAPYSFNKMGFEWNERGFRPEELPTNVTERVAVVTGANSGIGRATASELARMGFDVWLLCRDGARGREACEAIQRETDHGRVHLALVDMSSLKSIRSFIRDFAVPRVDVLIHNAGVLPDTKQLSEDGVELTFATNVLGPYALTSLLMDRLSEGADSRVIFVASGGLYLQRLDLALLDVDAKDFDGSRAYANAKRAQVILGHLLADGPSAKSVTFASMHPGWADTNAVRTSLPRFHAIMRRFLRSAEQGADTVVWLAASERARGTRGDFWFDRRVAPEYPFPWTRERAGARQELLSLCERLSGLTIQRQRGSESEGTAPTVTLP